MLPASLHLTTHLQVVGETDPQLPARVLALVTCRNELPIEFHVVSATDECVLLEMCLPGMDAEQRRQFADKVRKIPTVVSAVITLRGRACITTSL